MLPKPTFEQTFTELPETMYAKVAPTPVTKPEAMLLNDTLAQELGLDPDWLSSPEALQIYQVIKLCQILLLWLMLGTSLAI